MFTLSLVLLLQRDPKFGSTPTPSLSPLGKLASVQFFFFFLFFPLISNCTTFSKPYSSLQIETTNLPSPPIPILKPIHNA
ncbi:hypothetical protein BJX61DRAFT_38893 [Aspergillus egyptiacus]|nr:hypothetical protein BJX61DRAFT_38893 [Aspergillus egyptiacus]